MNVVDRMQHLNRELTEAAEEIRYLLGREYPKSSAVRFVSDHHRLKGTQRFILSRNVLAPAIAASRRSKRLACTDMQDRDIAIDGYNVLITLESFLKNEDMWVGDDGFIRDTRGVFSNHINDSETYAAVDLLVDMMVSSSIRSVTILLDSQMSKSGELAALLRQKIEEVHIKGHVLTSRTVDNELKRVSADSVVATADGIIIDALEHVVDIPACVIKGKKDKKYIYSLRPDNGP
ncbi:MAG: DUF434 domain-containing protein [Methanosarcinaceae archaeon]|nr:DUF434 domain-containing protein [Methanosarcinaceae archaeon]